MLSTIVYLLAFLASPVVLGVAVYLATRRDRSRPVIVRTTPSPLPDRSAPVYLSGIRPRRFVRAEDPRETLYPWAIDCDDTEPDLPAALACPACVALGPQRMCARCVNDRDLSMFDPAGEGGVG